MGAQMKSIAVFALGFGCAVALMSAWAAADQLFITDAMGKVRILQVDSEGRVICAPR